MDNDLRQSQTIPEGGAESHGSLTPGVESTSAYHPSWLVF